MIIFTISSTNLLIALNSRMNFASQIKEFHTIMFFISNRTSGCKLLSLPVLVKPFEFLAPKRAESIMVIPHYQ